MINFASPHFQDLLLFGALLVIPVLILFILLRKKRLSPGVVRDVVELIPESRFVDLEGARIHYVQAGSGPDIVLLHGIGASVFVWRFLFPLLQGRYRVTAVDLPGFGRSAKELKRDYGLDAQTSAVAEVLRLIGIESPVLVGSSMGGAIALWMAKVFPERFARVIALSPATDSRQVPVLSKYLVIASPLLRRALNRRFVRQMVGRVVANQNLITDKVVDAYMQPFVSDEGLGVRSFWAALSLLADRRLPRGLAQLRAKVLVIYGSRDLLVRRRRIDQLMRVLPHATLIVNENGGHHLMEDDPEWTAKTIEAFISGL